MEDFWANGHLDHPDEYSITGLEQFKFAGEHWATWAALTDMRIDIERAVLTVYEQVKDDLAGLLPLYAATTEVTCKDLAYVIPGKGEDAIRWRAAAIRDELRGMLGTLAGDSKRWREKFDGGEVVPAMQLLMRHEHNVMMVKAIHSLTRRQELTEVGGGVRLQRQHIPVLPETCQSPACRHVRLCIVMIFNALAVTLNQPMISANLLDRIQLLKTTSHSIILFPQPVWYPSHLFQLVCHNI